MWLGSFTPDGIILMRSLFDSDSMKFCGCIIAEVRNTSIKKIFESIDHKKTGDFILYDRNGGFLYSTYDSWWDMNWKEKEKETEEMQKRGEVLWTEYPISQGKLKLVHVVNLKEAFRSSVSCVRYGICGICGSHFVSLDDVRQNGQELKDSS